MNKFVRATLLQMIGVESSKADIKESLEDEDLIAKAEELTKKWNEQRIKAGLKPW